MESAVKQRLIEFLKYKKLSQKKFEQIVGLSNGYVNNIKKGLGAEKLAEISLHFPDLNEQWLLTGAGAMINSEEGASRSSGVPFFGELPVSGGRVVQYPDIKGYRSAGFVDIPQTHGAEFLFPVIGMSMKPTIEEGEIIGVTHTDRLETTNADRVYMIVTRDDERMIKRILRYDKTRGIITLGSDNPSYPDTELEACMVADVYKVVFHMKLETL